VRALRRLKLGKRGRGFESKIVSASVNIQLYTTQVQSVIFSTRPYAAKIWA
jgi:hypothetical protein